MIGLRRVLPRTASMQVQATRMMASQRLLELNNLQSNPGAIKKRRRWGRGIGSGRGKMCGFGHQKSRSTPMGFEGGQTPLYKRIPKFGFHNPNHKEFTALKLQTIQDAIDMGKLVVPENKPITIRDLVLAGLVTDLDDGVKLLATGKENFKYKLHLEVSRASKAAIEAVEKIGGTVTCVHLNELAMRALLRPYAFQYLPLRARPEPKERQIYLDYSRRGYLSPEVQARNLALFGAVTSEEFYRTEHGHFMAAQRMQK